jgi:hypothetical protein
MGALIPASDWLDFYLLSPRTCVLARVDYKDLVGFITTGSRWARLAGIEPTRFVRSVCFLLPGETELGSAEEQPNEG